MTPDSDLAVFLIGNSRQPSRLMNKIPTRLNPAPTGAKANMPKASPVSPALKVA